MTDEAHRVLMANAGAIKRGALSIWTIYDRPQDGVIARRFEVGGGDPEPKATDDTLMGELEALRGTFWAAGLMRLTRDGGDEPHIVESWV